MNSARIVVLGIAVVAAGGAAFLAKNMVGTPSTTVVEREISEVQVLVAKTNIRLGDAVTPTSLRWQAWPKDSAKGYITRQVAPRAIEKLSGSIARAPLDAGDPIKRKKLIKLENGGVMAAILPSGMRAISTPIRDQSNGVAGLILPNDRVDVIVTMRLKRRGGRGDQVVSETVLKNIRVLAIGQKFEMKDGEKIANGKSATLALQPRQAEILALAQSKGEIWLSLRSLADVNPKNVKRAAEPKWGSQRGTTLKVLKYGVPSQMFGVN